MGKKIVVCCDGTGNSFECVDEDSNVAKLYSSVKIDKDQVGYYHPGVGTMGSPNSRGVIAKEWSRVMGLAFGHGLLENVGDGYRYLMDTYADGDEIYLFGFSRGAFTARDEPGERRLTDSTFLAYACDDERCHDPDIAQAGKNASGI